VRVDAQNSHVDFSIQHLRNGIEPVRKREAISEPKSGGAKVLTLRRSADSLEIFAWENFQERRKNTAKKNLHRKKAEKQKLPGMKRREN